MTWDQRQAAVFSAAIRSHRMGMATPAPERISLNPSAEFSSWLVRPTSARARNVARHWLTVALLAAETKVDLDRSLTARERWDCKQDVSDLRMWLADLGQFEDLPTRLLLTADMQVPE